MKMGGMGMDPRVYWKFIEQGRKPEAAETTIAYLAEHLGKFLKKGERVLICFRYREEGSLSWFFESAGSKRVRGANGRVS